MNTIIVNRPLTSGVVNFSVRAPSSGEQGATATTEPAVSTMTAAMTMVAPVSTPLPSNERSVEASARPGGESTNSIVMPVSSGLANSQSGFSGRPLINNQSETPSRLGSATPNTITPSHAVNMSSHEAKPGVLVTTSLQAQTRASAGSTDAPQSTPVQFSKSNIPEANASVSSVRVTDEGRRVSSMQTASPVSFGVKTSTIAAVAHPGAASSVALPLSNHSSILAIVSDGLLSSSGVKSGAVSKSTMSFALHASLSRSKGTGLALSQTAASTMKKLVPSGSTIAAGVGSLGMTTHVPSYGHSSEIVPVKTSIAETTIASVGTNRSPGVWNATMGFVSPSQTTGAKPISSNRETVAVSALASATVSSFRVRESPDGLSQSTVRSLAKSTRTLFSAGPSSHQALPKSAASPIVSSHISGVASVVQASNASIVSSPAVREKKTLATSLHSLAASSGGLGYMSLISSSDLRVTGTGRSTLPAPAQTPSLSQAASVAPAKNRTPSTSVTFKTESPSPSQKSRSMHQTLSVESTRTKPSASHSPALRTHSPPLMLSLSPTRASPEGFKTSVTSETPKGSSHPADQSSRFETPVSRVTMNVVNQTSAVDVSSISGSSSEFAIASSSAIPTATPSPPGTRIINVEASIANETFHQDLNNRSSSKFKRLFNRVNKSVRDRYLSNM